MSKFELPLSPQQIFFVLWTNLELQSSIMTLVVGIYSI